MADATTPAKGLILPTVGGDSNEWGDVLNTTLGLIDLAIGGTLQRAITGNTQLTFAEVQNTGFHFTGTLTSAATVTFPSFFGLAVIRNETGQVLTCGGDGQKAAVPNGTTLALWSDGTDFIALSGGNANGGLPVVGNAPPASPTVGQLWFDTNTLMLKVWTGAWTLASRLPVTGTPPSAPFTGQLWFDARVALLKLWDGTTWVLASSLPPVSASPPGTPIVGQMWYDTAASGLKIYTGGWTQVSTPGRIRSFNPITMYVSSIGNDNNDGLSPNTAFNTLQRPLQVLAANYDLMGGVSVTVRVADGTYTGGATLSGQSLVGGNTVSYVGNLTQPINCKIALNAPGACFQSQFGGNLIVSGFALEASQGTNGARWTGIGIGLNATLGGAITFGAMAFGSVTHSHMSAGIGGQLSIGSQYGAYSVYGSAGAWHIGVGSGGAMLAIPDARATIINNPSFGVGFACADSSSLLYAPGATFNGVAQGRRYLASNNGVILTAGGGASFFPGNSPGDSTTGRYS